MIKKGEVMNRAQYIQERGTDVTKVARNKPKDIKYHTSRTDRLFVVFRETEQGTNRLKYANLSTVEDVKYYNSKHASGELEVLGFYLLTDYQNSTMIMTTTN
jgi:hypothetical protein